MMSRKMTFLGTTLAFFATISICEAASKTTIVSSTDLQKEAPDLAQAAAEIVAAGGAVSRPFRLDISDATGLSFMDVTMLEGLYLKIERLPSHPVGIPILSDTLVNRNLNELLRNGFPLVLVSSRQGYRAAVFPPLLATEEIIRNYFPDAKSRIMFSVTVKANRFVIRHEFEHVAQEESTHPMRMTLGLLTTEYPGLSIVGLKQFLKELLAYREEIKFLESQNSGDEKFPDVTMDYDYKSYHTNLRKVSDYIGQRSEHIDQALRMHSSLVQRTFSADPTKYCQVLKMVSARHQSQSLPIEKYLHLTCGEN